MSNSKPTFIEALMAFNRKERFHVVGFALGNLKFSIDEDCRRRLGDKLRLSIPDGAVAAMDYHLDWIYFALYCAKHGYPRDKVEKDAALVTGTLEDVDLLIAFPDGADTHLVFIEAKGATGFTNKQLQSKADRLCALFGPHGSDWSGVTPHFMLMSPKRPKRLKCEKWPAWMQPNDGHPIWLELPFGTEAPGGLRQAVRCNDAGAPSDTGRYWALKKK